MLNPNPEAACLATTQPSPTEGQPTASPPPESTRISQFDNPGNSIIAMIQRWDNSIGKHRSKAPDSEWDRDLLIALRALIFESLATTPDDSQEFTRLGLLDLKLRASNPLQENNAASENLAQIYDQIFGSTHLQPTTPNLIANQNP